MTERTKTRPSTTSQLRAAIDSGATRDKIAYPDPAASPLGTDAEAGGMPPTAAEVRRAPTWASRPRWGNDSFVYPLIVLPVVAAYLAIIWLAA